MQDSFERLRTLLLTETALEHLAPMGPGVFKGVAVDTCIVVTKKASPPIEHQMRLRAPSHPLDLASTPEVLVAQARFAANPRKAIDYRMDAGSSALVDRLRRKYPGLEAGYEFGVGVNTGSMRAEMTSKLKVDGRYRPMISGSGIERYGRVRSTGWIAYDPAMVRAAGARGRSLPPQRFFDEPKILVVRTRNLALRRRVIATIDESGAYNLNRLTNIIARAGYSLEGLLGILNSSLFNWIFAGTFYDYEIKPTYLRSCPLADTNDATLVARVRTMRAAVARRDSARSVPPSGGI